jgi:hypothetical protein
LKPRSKLSDWCSKAATNDSAVLVLTTDGRSGRLEGDLKVTQKFLTIKYVDVILVGMLINLKDQFDCHSRCKVSSIDSFDRVKELRKEPRNDAVDDEGEFGR